MKSLIIVESPLQLINALEALDYFNISKYKIVIRISGFPLNDKQLRSIIIKLELPTDKIQFIKVFANSNKMTLVNLLRYLFIPVYLFCVSLLYKKVFLGNFESSLFKLIIFFSKKRIILLDDGSKTLLIQKQFSDSFKIDLYSIFKFKSQKYENRYINKFKKLRALIRERNYNFSDRVYFLGAKLNEVGYMSETEYIVLLGHLFERFNIEKIVYVGHRGEDQEKLKRISETYKIEIILLDYPIELICLYESEIPRKVVSFFSTALISLSIIFEDELEVMSFKFNYSKSKYKNNLDVIYKYYEKYMPVIQI